MVRTLAATGNDEGTATHVQPAKRTRRRVRFVFVVTIPWPACSRESTQLLTGAQGFIRDRR